MLRCSGHLSHAKQAHHTAGVAPLGREERGCRGRCAIGSPSSRSDSPRADSPPRAVPHLRTSGSLLRCGSAAELAGRGCPRLARQWWRFLWTILPVSVSRGTFLQQQAERWEVEPSPSVQCLEAPWRSGRNWPCRPCGCPRVASAVVMGLGRSAWFHLEGCWGSDSSHKAGAATAVRYNYPTWHRGEWAGAAMGVHEWKLGWGQQIADVHAALTASRGARASRGPTRNDKDATAAGAPRAPSPASSAALPTPKK
jgi:hypothetical protein